MAENNKTNEPATDTKDVIEYKNKKVIIKKAPQNGEDIAVYARPGDNIEIEGVNLDSLEYRFVGGDIVVTMPNGGMLTFVSMALMGYNENPPYFVGSGNKQVSLSQILSDVEEINDLPFESLPVEADIQKVDKVKKIVEKLEDTVEKLSQEVAQQNNYDQTINDFNNQQNTKQNEFDNIESEINTNTYQVSNPEVEKVNFRAYYDTPNIYAQKEVEELMPVNDFTDYYQDAQDGFGDGFGDSYEDGPGEVTDAAKPEFYFKATVHQYKQNESITDDFATVVLGGGGSLNGYAFDSITNQFEDETIDVSARTENLIIKAEDPTYFSNNPSDIYLSRILRFEPQMPEGFYVDSFSLSGLPTGVVLLDNDGVKIVGNEIIKDDFIIKDANGNVIDSNSPSIATSFKSAEFAIKYSDPDALPSTFDVAITANYKLDDAFLTTTDINPSQVFTTDYTFAVKSISSADDFTYNTTNFPGGQEEGFVLAKEINNNIIKDGSGDSTIYGGIVEDIVYDGEGDDSIYLSDQSDTVYAGSGINRIDGDANADAADSAYTLYTNDSDKISYTEVKSYSLAELTYLDAQGKLSTEEYNILTGNYSAVDEDGNPTETPLDIDMQTYYKGVYVDMEGIYVESLDINVDGSGDITSDDKINAISKFAIKEDGSFTYDPISGDVLSTTITQTGLDNLQQVGYDIFTNIENIDGSNYNDTIYGNSSANILSGLAGSDVIDGRDGGNTLYGNGGYDTLYSGAGDDTIDGGGDTDAVNYQNAASGVTVRLDKPSGDPAEEDFATGDGTDTLIDIEDVVGSEHNDIIYGSGATNFIEGKGGDDKIIGGKGYDFIDGGDGSDWISYYASVDDYPDIGTNSDYMEDIQGITVAMGSDFVMLKETSTGRLIDLIKDVEQVRGTAGIDKITGNNSDEIFWGMEGNDDLRGNNGADELYGGDGDDYLRPGRGIDFTDGGIDTDWLELYDDALISGQSVRIAESFVDSGAAQGTLQYYDTTTSTWKDGYETIDGIETAINIEGLGASKNRAINLTGNSLANVLTGRQQADTIDGMAGNDTIRGSNGDDTLYGGAGDDIMYGDADDDTIDAGSGNDIVYGYGKYNNNTNKDTMDGGADFDTLNYSATKDAITLNMSNSASNGIATNAATVTFSTGGNYTDTITNFESIIGGRSNDTITANDSGMRLDGWSGTDTLTGGSGNDTIIARNTSGETLDGQGGTDTLQLAQNVDFRNDRITISDFEILDMQTFNAYVSLSRFSQFDTIKGSGTFYLYGTSGADTLDFSNLDLNDFTGRFYVNGSGGDDIFDFSTTTLNSDAEFLLDGSSGSDTLVLGNNANADNLTINMPDNYYNSFEVFDVDSGSTINVTAANNNGRSFYAHNKNFTAVDGDINLIGGTGNDIFYVDYQALADAKINVDGNTGTDIVDVRTTISSNTLTFDDVDMFANIERLELDQNSTRTNAVEINANAVDNWLTSGSNSLTLDINNNTQGSVIDITGATAGSDPAGLTIGSSYSITSDTDHFDFSMSVV